MTQSKENSIIALQISESLNEKEIELILALVDFKGVDFSLNMLEKTKSILKEGGMLTKKGKQRTPGGIFFYLIRENLPKEESDKVFRPQIIERRRRARARKSLLKKISNLQLTS